MSKKSQPLGHADLSMLYGQLATLDANPTIEAIRTARKSYGEIADRFAASGNSGEAQRIRALGSDLLGASITMTGNVGTVDITGLQKEIARHKKQLGKIESRLTALETASKQYSVTLYGTTGENPTPGLQSQFSELVKPDGALAQLTNAIGTLNGTVNGTVEQRNEDGSTIPATPGINGRIGRIEGDMARIFGNPAQPDQPSLQSRVEEVETRLRALQTVHDRSFWLWVLIWGVAGGLIGLIAGSIFLATGVPAFGPSFGLFSGLVLGILAGYFVINMRRANRAQ